MRHKAKLYSITKRERGKERVMEGSEQASESAGVGGSGSRQRQNVRKINIHIYTTYTVQK